MLFIHRYFLFLLIQSSTKSNIKDFIHLNQLWRVICESLLLVGIQLVMITIKLLHLKWKKLSKKMKREEMEQLEPKFEEIKDIHDLPSGLLNHSTILEVRILIFHKHYF